MKPTSRSIMFAQKLSLHVHIICLKNDISGTLVLDIVITITNRVNIEYAGYTLTESKDVERDVIPSTSSYWKKTCDDITS
jgi:hypothetical protein